MCTRVILSVVWACILEGEALSAEFSTNRWGNWSCVRNGNQSMLEWKRNVMAHAQKPDSVFQWNGRVHLYRWGCQFSQVLAFLECGSGENDCSNTGWTVLSETEDCLATHSIRLFPLHFSSRASPCATRFRFHSTHVDCCQMSGANSWLMKQITENYVHVYHLAVLCTHKAGYPSSFFRVLV